DLVVVGGAVGDGAVGVAGDGPEGREQGLCAAGGGPVELVPGDRRAAVGGRCAPAESDGVVPGGRGVERRRAGARRRGRPALVGVRVSATGVCGGDLVLVGGAVGDGAVGVAGDGPEGGEQGLCAAGGGAVELVPGDRRAAVGGRRAPAQADVAVARGR